MVRPQLSGPEPEPNSMSPKEAFGWQVHLARMRYMRHHQQALLVQPPKHNNLEWWRAYQAPGEYWYMASP